MIGTMDRRTLLPNHIQMESTIWEDTLMVGTSRDMRPEEEKHDELERLRGAMEKHGLKRSRETILV